MLLKLKLSLLFVPKTVSRLALTGLEASTGSPSRPGCAVVVQSRGAVVHTEVEQAVAACRAAVQSFDHEWGGAVSDAAKEVGEVCILAADRNRKRCSRPTARGRDECADLAGSELEAADGVNLHVEGATSSVSWRCEYGDVAGDVDAIIVVCTSANIEPCDATTQVEIAIDLHCLDRAGGVAELTRAAEIDAKISGSKGQRSPLPLSVPPVEIVRLLSVL